MAKNFEIKQAVREKKRARIALDGPSGSGKTLTGLILITTLGQKPVVIDTEQESASLYAPPPSRLSKPGPMEFNFDHLPMHYYDPRDLTDALAYCAGQGYDAVLIDSGSKFWNDQGGMLDQVDKAGKRNYGGNGFGGWKEASPMEKDMLQALLHYPGHIVFTMRVKTEFVMVENERGRTVPMKIGLAPVQRAGIEYEFDVVGDMDLQHALTISKTRCNELADKVFQRPDESLAEIIQNWCDEGKEMPTALNYRDQAVDKDAGYQQLLVLHHEVKTRAMLNVVVMDEEGNQSKLGDLIIRRGKEAAKAEGVAAAAQPARPEPESGDPWDTGAPDAQGGDASQGEPASASQNDAGESADDGNTSDVPPAVEDSDASQEALAEPDPPGDKLDGPTADLLARINGTETAADLMQRQKEIGSRVGNGQLDPDIANRVLMPAIKERRAELRKGGR